jgi:hypothetical protein
MDFLNHFWTQVAVSVSEVKRPSRGRFGSDTENKLTAKYIPRAKVPAHVQRPCNDRGRWSELRLKLPLHSRLVV